PPVLLAVRRHPPGRPEVCPPRAVDLPAGVPLPVRLGRASVGTRATASEPYRRPHPGRAGPAMPRPGRRLVPSADAAVVTARPFRRRRLSRCRRYRRGIGGLGRPVTALLSGHLCRATPRSTVSNTACNFLFLRRHRT
ncbi:unnamed protein product, partial [Ectocarpus sp. 12 AP-2014]